MVGLCGPLQLQAGMVEAMLRCWYGVLWTGTISFGASFDKLLTNV